MWGKVLGAAFGFMFGKWVGLLLGIYVGHMFDRSLRQDFDRKGGFSRFFDGGKDRQAIFFHATFAVMGHIAKSNGRVTEQHIQAASLLMDHMGLNKQQKREAQEAFREGKLAEFDVKETLKDFKRSVYGRREVLQMFVEIQIQAAYSDGHVNVQERELLGVVAKSLGFSDADLQTMLSRWEAEFRFHQEKQQRQQHQQQQQQQGGQRQQQRTHPASRQSLQDAFELLGVSPKSSASEIKKAYKKQMNQHHPDKLVSKGLPPEMMELAKIKAQDIQAAYDMIRTEKNMR